ncbi:hypothetical protein PT282_01145 [Bifidobacterium sp. ESL0763]|uniref:hypothetical protein n=1 Tax=Bifidobacterium sp. ESL0763 TaxID=2983227 RepID=UPI0023F8EB99|nr:hypothetical protein [Bifidobacterium sp. ESL0763]MDF7663288.1 hypothetical protein [Bifidobacterium sp. ESL0763]
MREAGFAPAVAFAACGKRSYSRQFNRRVQLRSIGGVAMAGVDANAMTEEGTEYHA